MFDNYSNSQKTRASADYKAAKAVFDSMRNLGKDNASIKAVLESMLAGKLWKDEIISMLFNGRTKQEKRDRYYENRREQQQRDWDDWFNRSGYYRNSQNREYNTGTSFSKALGFFGFIAMPEADELKRRYRELALKLHPDKGGDTATFQKFQNYKDILFARAGI